jgi:hypothetical protein
MTQDIRITSHGSTGWRQNAWLIPVAVVLLDLLIVSLPPFLTFDPTVRQALANSATPDLHYGLILIHVLFGTIAVVTACLGVWPWLRIRHPAAHRWSGRLYVFLGAMPAALLSLGVNYLHNGWHGDMGGYVQAGFWFLTTLIGYVAIRKGNYLRHRRWMLYSFAMTTSVIWGPLGAEFIPAEGLLYLHELTRWVGWLVNLIVIKWWLDRTDRRSMMIHIPAQRQRQSPKSSLITG